MGSPEFAIPVLRKLVEAVEVIGVITQPDRPAGRGKSISPPPIKTLAESYHLPVIQPERLKEPEARAQIEKWAPDLIVVAAFGQILRSWVLDLPKYGCINVHGSLLPRWRGASPIQAAIIHGDVTTGITIMKMDPGIDTGDILSQESEQILPEDTTTTLSRRLSELGSELLIKTVEGFLDGSIQPVKQNDEMACYAGMIKKEEAFLDFTEPAILLERKIRAYQPWPVAKYNGLDNQISILKSSVKYIGMVEPGKRYIHEKKPAIGTSNG